MIPVDAEWAMLPGGVAVVEMARASGLALVDGRNDPLRASTRGTGELIATVLRSGARRVIVGVGGSASTDGGLAAVETLGWSIDGIPITVACDVSTRFLDAARVFGPQKGATDAQVALLTRRLARLADEYEARTGVDVRELAGAGAAGGLAGGLAAIGASSSRGSTWSPTPPASKTRSTTWSWWSREKASSTSPASTARPWAASLDWAADAGVPHIAVIAGQVTPEAREELAVRPGIQVLALTDRVWQGGEAFAAGGDAGRGGRAGGGAEGAGTGRRVVATRPRRR